MKGQSKLLYGVGGGGGTERGDRVGKPLFKSNSDINGRRCFSTENMSQDFRGCSDGTHFTDVETEVQRSSCFCPLVSKGINFGV